MVHPGKDKTEEEEAHDGTGVSGTSLDKNTARQGRGMEIQKYSKVYEDANENNKAETYRTVSGRSSSEYWKFTLI